MRISLIGTVCIAVLASSQGVQAQEVTYRLSVREASNRTVEVVVPSKAYRLNGINMGKGEVIAPATPSEVMVGDVVYMNGKPGKAIRASEGIPARFMIFKWDRIPTDETTERPVVANLTPGMPGGAMSFRGPMTWFAMSQVIESLTFVVRLRAITNPNDFTGVGMYGIDGKFMGVMLGSETTTGYAMMVPQTVIMNFLYGERPAKVM